MWKLSVSNESILSTKNEESKSRFFKKNSAEIVRHLNEGSLEKSLVVLRVDKSKTVRFLSSLTVQKKNAVRSSKLSCSS